VKRRPDSSLRSDLVPLGEFPSPSETAVVIGLLESAGIPAFYDRPRYRGSHDPRIYVARETLDDAKRVLARARTQSHFVPEPVPSPDERPSLMTAMLWILAAVMLTFFIHDLYHWIEHYLP
jgi:hypothetical protein